MSSASDLHAFCDWLRAEVEAPVMLGKPDDAVPGLYVWPWRIAAPSAMSNTPPRQHERPSVASAMDIYFLLMPVPAAGAEGLASLESARRAIDEHPVSNSGMSQFRVLGDTGLVVADLTQLFIAAGSS